MVYIALLRGVNVAGKPTVSMAALKACFEGLGFGDVRTYINSGNVIFRAAQATNDALASQIEAALAESFTPGVRALIKSRDELQRLGDAIPETWVNDTAFRCEVIFLWPEIDRPEVLGELPSNPELEDVRYAPGAALWHVSRSLVTKSRMTQIIGTPLYQQMTIRNLTTVRKLLALANEIT